MITKKKLIEVALPLDAINKACAREKSIRHGHPGTLHLWWAPRPLAAARAVIFAQMVDDPSSCPDLFPTEKAQEKERQRLFKIIEDLVLWKNTTDETVLQAARAEIWASWRRACAENADHPRAKELFDRAKLPAFHDPFAGGGALPLEAQRLGLESYASDLNPVAVLINKAKIEIPPKFAGKPPVNPEWHAKKKEEKAMASWHGAQGLAEDVRYYSEWWGGEVQKRTGHLYPLIEVTAAMAKARPDLKPYVGQNLTVIAWIWARTVKSPNPAFAHVDVPLAASFILANKPGKEAYVEPELASGGYRFVVKHGKPKDSKAAQSGTKLDGSTFMCLMSRTPITGEYIKSEGKAGRMGAKLMAVVAEGERGRLYLSPTEPMEAAADKVVAAWGPEGEIPTRMTGGSCVPYGITRWRDIFSKRQLVTMTTLSDLVAVARRRVREDAITAGLIDDGVVLDAGGRGAQAYSDAIATYLECVLDKLAECHTTICTWSSAPKNELVVSTFRRQALPMTWDFAESNPFADSSGSVDKIGAAVARAMAMALPASPMGAALQTDASTQSITEGKVVSTDPPYYDNIGYADLSDFFYVWMRPTLKSVFPALFATLAVPKEAELVATAHRHGTREKAETFFLHGMTEAMRRLATQAHPAFPVTIYYAYKQAEGETDEGAANTGWETFLDAVIRAGFSITGTWPVRTERGGRSIGIGTNALASSIVLVCRQRDVGTPTATRREFVTQLSEELPAAVAHLRRENIAPVDLAQAAIGPGMAVFTRYAKVLDAKGKPLSVREALTLINQTLDEALAEQEGDFDADSRWALAWFEQSGFAEGEYGVAETLSTAKNTAVSGLVEAGILAAGRGKVRLLKPKELPADWDPTTDTRLTTWEIVHQLIRVLEAGGELAAAGIVAKLGTHAESARELCYRLYALCERKKRAAEALSYNALVQSWPEITRLAQEGGKPRPVQGGLFDGGEE